ncbi:MAG: hypothetical protein Kow00108_17650 [Calditrichia bacterium]
MRILVDQSFWISVVDKNDKLHEKSVQILKDILSENHQLYITSFIYNELLYYIRKNLPDAESRLFNIFQEALENNYLKLINLGRLSQREAIRLWSKHTDWPYKPGDLSNLFIMKRRFINSILTWRNEYKSFNINILNQ